MIAFQEALAGKQAAAHRLEGAIERCPGRLGLGQDPGALRGVVGRRATGFERGGVPGRVVHTVRELRGLVGRSACGFYPPGLT